MSVMKTGCTGSTDTDYNDVEYDKGYDYFVMFIAFVIAYRFWVAIY